MRKKEELFDIVRDMKYTDAVAAVSSEINAQTQPCFYCQPKH
jgi:hypothetical protein